MTNKQREQTSREVFEAEMTDRGMRIDVDADGDYLDLFTHRCWIVWQAATQWADR